MDFMNTLNFAYGADLTNVEIEMPDELGEKLGMALGGVIMAVAEVAQHFYGENPTEEQIEESAVLAIMWLRKQMGLNQNYG